VIPIAVLGFLASQLAQESRREQPPDEII
jgi:hypothetical protein